MTPPSTPVGAEPDLADRQYQASLQSDIELLDLYVLGGQTQALLTLLSRFTPMITSVIRRVVSHAQDSEDAYQATCVILMQSAKRIRSRRSIAAWLYGVAYRTACRVRSKSRRQATGIDPLEVPDQNLPDDPIHQIVRQIELSNLDRELQNLPEAYREPLVEHYIFGYTARQIAERMELSSSAVEGRLRRGRQMLRERLAERGASLSVCVAGVAWMRDHQQTLISGHELADQFAQSTAFQSPNSLSEHDSYLFELVEGETKMQVASLFKSVGFLGTVAAATVSLSVLALAMQGLDNRGKRGTVTAAANPNGIQAVQAVDDETTTKPQVVETQAPREVKAAAAQPDVAARPANSADIIRFAKPTDPAPNWLKAGEEAQAATEKTRDLLRESSKLEFKDSPLKDVARALGKQWEVNVVLDRTSIDNNGLSEDQPVTAQFEEMPLHQSLSMMLKPMRLAYEVHPNLIKIVNENDVEPALRYYDLSRVVPNSASVRNLIATALVVIDNQETESSVSVIGSMMVARCNEASHLKLEKLLAQVAKLPPENLPTNESQTKDGGVFQPGLGGLGGGLGGFGGGTGGMGGGGMF